MKIKRQRVQECVAKISPWDLCGTPEDIFKVLVDYQYYYLDKLNIEYYSLHWGWESSSDDHTDGCFALTITRLENDKEYNSRIKTLMTLKENKKQQKQNEYDEYLRLKKKFGDQ